MELKICKTDRQVETVQLDIARPEDAEDIFHFFLENYYSAEPTNHLFEYEKAEIRRNLKNVELPYIRDEYLVQPYSLIVRQRVKGDALTSNADQRIGCIAAAQIAKIEERKDYEKNNRPDEPYAGTDTLIMAIVDELYRDVNIYDLFNTDRILHGKISIIIK